MHTASLRAHGCRRTRAHVRAYGRPVYQDPGCCGCCGQMGSTLMAPLQKEMILTGRVKVRPSTFGKINGSTQQIPINKHGIRGDPISADPICC